MSNQVVTIGYLKEFVSGKLTVNTNNPDTYCPTYAELTGGSLVKNYSAGANPKDTVNGIDIPNCTVNIGYENNQLVIRQDLLLKYMVLDSIAITADSTSISQCGGQTNVCVKGTFHLETKSEGGSIEKGGSETDSTIQATWSGDADNSGPSTCTVISFGENTVGGYGTSNPTTAPSRNESTTATYTYKGTNLTSVNDTTKTSNTVTITQAANNVHDWYYEGKTDYATSLVASCPGNVSENGGTATVTSTLYYEQDWRCDDDCGNTVGYKYVSASKSGPSTSVTFAEQDCDEPERCETVSLSMSGQSTSCSVCQDESSVPCYCGENCAGNCNTTIHWHCAEKQSYTNMGTTYTINGLDGDGCLPCSGGTATVIIHGTTDTELYTRAAECRTATLSTTMGKTADQTVVGLVQSHTGETGSGTYYDYLYGRSYTVPTNKYTAYTQYHYMAYNTAGKHNRNETTYQYDTLGTSYKYEVLEYSFNDYYISSKKFYSKSDFVDEGNSAATWDAAMEKYNNSATCSGGTGDDCSGGTWVYDEDLNPNETGITGNYKVWFTNYTNFSKMNDEMMDRVPNVCYVASISPNKTMFYSASTSSNSMVKTFEFAANTTTAATNGSVTFTSDNPSVGNSPNKIEKITVHYKVAACTNDTDKYTISSVTAPSTAVACSAVPGNGVNITVSGAHSIVKVSQADPKVSGETTASAYTMTQGTDYTMNYTPTGSNTGIEDRTVTVTITGIGKFSGQTKTVTYTQKADTACTTATTCTPSTSYTYSSYSVSYNGGAVNCNAEPSKSKITVTANKTTTTKDVFCQESSTTENGVSITDFSVSYSPSGNNTGTSNRTVTGTVTHNGSTAGTFTFTQNSGSTCQATVTSTTYTYRIDAADFDACDSETTVTVYATPTYYYSDGSNAKGEETEISVFPLPTITYRLGTGETTVTASQNSTSGSRIWTVTASFRHNNSNQTASDTATQSAGPCNTGSTASTCMNIEYSVPVALSSSVIVSFKDSSGAIIAAHTVPSTTGTTTKEICGLTNGKALTASCSDDTVTMSGGINFNFSAGTTEYITIQAPNSGPTGSTVYEYTFKNCYSDRQIGLFASNATPSGSHLQFAMLSALDGTAATVLVTSNNGTLVNGSSSNSSSSAKIGDSVKVYSVTNTTNIWTLEETITLTAEDRSFEYGNCTSCTCSVTSISVSPTTHTFTSNSSKSFTVTINDNDCDKCKGGFKVYNSSGTYVTSGTSTFSLSNQTGTFTIRANDNTRKTCTLTTTEYTTTTPVCNVPMGTFAGDYDFRVDFSEAVTSDVTIYIDEKDGDCNVINSFEVTVLKGRKTGYGYNVLGQKHDDVVAAYFEITNVSPSSDSKYYYWGNGCEYDDSGNCTPLVQDDYEFYFTENDGETTWDRYDSFPSSGVTGTDPYFITSLKNGSEQSYSVSSNQTWLTYENSDSSYVIPIVAENTTSSERSGTLTLTQSGSNKKLYIKISQNAYSITKTSIKVQSVSVTTNGGASSSNYGGYVTVSLNKPIEHGELTVRVGFNYECDNDGNSYSETFSFNSTNKQTVIDGYFAQNCYYRDLCVNTPLTAFTFISSTDEFDKYYTFDSTTPTMTVDKNCSDAPAPTTYSCKINYVNNTSETSKTAIVNLITTGLTAGQSKTLTLVGTSGSVKVTDTKAITWCIDSITNTNSTKTYNYTSSSGSGCFSLTVNGNEVTITISDSTPPPTPCSCSVTSISVSPTTHKFTSSGSAYFTVTINDNDCSGCTNQFLVYKSDGTHVTSGIGTFNLSNQSGTFTIKAKDNQNKTCTLTTTKYTAPVYVFKFNNPTDGFDSTSTETHIIHKLVYEGVGPTTTLTSTKDGSNVGYTMSSNVNWITTSTASTTCSWNISKNTSTSSRSGTITLTQSGSNKTLTISVTQGGAPATCDCSTVSISCNPTNSYTTGNSVSTVVTVNAGSNCSTKWKAYSSSGSYLGEGESGKSFSRTTTGTVTFRSDACSGKTTTWTVGKPECAKPIIRLSGSGDAYVLQNYSEIDEWCGTSPNVSVSTSADYIGDGSDYTHYSPTTCSFEIANCAASITSINLDSGGWILDSYSGLNSFGISFTIRPDAIMNATCRLRGSFTYLMQGTPFSGTFSISIQFNG